MQNISGLVVLHMSNAKQIKVQYSKCNVSTQEVVQ